MKRTLLVPFKIAALSIGGSVVGESINSQPLKDTSAAAGKFVAPAVNIVMGGAVIGMARSLRRSNGK